MTFLLVFCAVTNVIKGQVSTMKQTDAKPSVDSGIIVSGFLPGFKTTSVFQDGTCSGTSNFAQTTLQFGPQLSIESFFIKLI